MISREKLEANRRNAKKSTGPRTQEGKRRSSLNAMKHGLTSRIPLLPHEDPGQFDDRMAWWIQNLKPQNGLELIQVSRAAYCSWQLSRVERAQAARLCTRALNEQDDRRRREEVEVTELALLLLSNPGEMRSGSDQSQPGRPEDRGTSGTAGNIAFDATNHPALVGGRLESTKTGCLWLLEQWAELGSILENNGAWLAPARFKAARLMGTFPGDPLTPLGFDAMLRDCPVLDPNAADLAGMLSPEGHEDAAERSTAAVLAEPTDARQDLLEMVKNQTERIEARLVEHEERAELEEIMSNHHLSFDESPQGERLRRYELIFHRFVFQTIEKFSRRNRNNSPDRYASANVGIDRSQFSRYLPVVAGMGAATERELAEPEESDEIDDEKVDASVVAGRMPKGEAMAEQESAAQNEPTGLFGDESAQNVSRVEVALRKASAFADEGGRLVRNEATAVGLPGANRGNGVAKLDGGSRRERRARRARERANGKVAR